jgi:hypothetical protein
LCHDQEIPQALPPLTAEERAGFLSWANRNDRAIDESLLAEVTNTGAKSQWSLLAQWIARVTFRRSGHVLRQRMCALVEEGRVEARRVEYMRFSECGVHLSEPQCVRGANKRWSDRHTTSRAPRAGCALRRGAQRQLNARPLNAR